MYQPRRCQIFAHRGANKEAAENTRSAFDKALYYAIDGIETDVQLSRDQITVLWHDDFLDKLGLSTAQRIEDFDYAQLGSMDFAGERIMALHEFIAAYRRRCRLLLEIKYYTGENAARQQLKVRQTLGLLGMLQNDDVMVSSFHLASLCYAHEEVPDVPLVYNLEADQSFAEAKEILIHQPYLYGLCVPIQVLELAWVDLVHRQEKCLAVYTCNTDEEIARCLALGVDILITDYPAKALRLRQA